MEDCTPDSLITLIIFMLFHLIFNSLVHGIMLCCPTTVGVHVLNIMKQKSVLLTRLREILYSIH